MRPPMFFGSSDATVASVVVFWVVLFGWIGTEMWLGARRRRLPAGATDYDSGSKWWLIGSVWATITIGIWVALLLPSAAIASGRTPLFILGLLLMVAGIVLRCTRSALSALPSPARFPRVLARRSLKPGHTAGSGILPTRES